MYQKKYPRSTSWQQVGKWYKGLVSDKGHFYHQSLIMPGVIRLLALQNNSSLLDLACGQGVLARHIPKISSYLGIDSSSLLIDAARLKNHQENYKFIVGDVTKPLPVTKTDFSHTAIILALQNIQNPQVLLSNAQKHLVSGGKLVIVINHPCFRIPRQSSWEIDQKNKLEYRRINRYLTPLKIPISNHPGHTNSPITWSFHWPISAICNFLFQVGFVIETIEEWASGKTSVGKAARMENRARSEFPLFMAIAARKI